MSFLSCLRLGCRWFPPSFLDGFLLVTRRPDGKLFSLERYPVLEWPLVIPPVHRVEFLYIYFIISFRSFIILSGLVSLFIFFSLFIFWLLLFLFVFFFCFSLFPFPFAIYSRCYGTVATFLSRGRCVAPANRGGFDTNYTEGAGRYRGLPLMGSTWASELNTQSSRFMRSSSLNSR